MKLTTILVAASCLTARAFGVSPRTTSVVKSINSNDVVSNSLRKQAPSTISPLFRDAGLTRGGAVPGWAAYNEALDKNPLTAKACTSLVGWFLGDLLAQVRVKCVHFIFIHCTRYYLSPFHCSVINVFFWPLFSPMRPIQYAIYSCSSSSLVFWTSDVLSPYLLLDSFTMDQVDITSTVGSMRKSKETMPKL